MKQWELAKRHNDESIKLNMCTTLVRKNGKIVGSVHYRKYKK